MAVDFSFIADDASSRIGVGSTPGSSPPPIEMGTMDDEYVPDQHLANLEFAARERNIANENKRKAFLKRKRTITKAQREEKAKQLDNLLCQSAAFSEILTKKTQALGRVGNSLDGKALGEHDLTMAEQPKCMIGGTMRDYQLEGVTWMYEVCLQGMSGILADEMGLGKTIQAIGIVALLREQEDYLGPHIIIAPLSTLSNWIAEFQKWAPSIPVVMYHGTREERQNIHKTKLLGNIKNGRPNERFPVVCTSYEMVIRDSTALSKINWEFIIIDEGHRMKNAESRLFEEVCKFKSSSRFLITGTPLQNNLKELWSLLHFLMPSVFTDWEAFETWFDFSDLQDEEGTERFVEDKTSHDLVNKIHSILQPLLLRRVKADVAHHLPKKREYVLYAPMSKEQTDLYNLLMDKTDTARSYLENKLFDRLTGTTNSLAGSRKFTPHSSRSGSAQLRTDDEATSGSAPNVGSASKNGRNVFNLMMNTPQKRGRRAKNAPTISKKRKDAPNNAKETPILNRPEQSGQCAPMRSSKVSTRNCTQRAYKLAETDDDDDLSDDEFEAKIVRKYAEYHASKTPSVMESVEESQRAATLEVAKKQIAAKKLGNLMQQLRLVCDSPLNFYDPFPNGEGLDDTIVTSSGKMLLLDRLLPALFERGHKVLLFSQFKTQLDVLTDYCQLRGWDTCRIDGGVSQKERKVQIDAFNSNDDLRLFLLSTRSGGQGINLASADTVILYDSDWNPQQDLQAQDRAHRIGQIRPVVVYRLATKGTVEESLLMSAYAKRRLEKLVIRKGSYRTLGQKKDEPEELDDEALRHLLLKDGEVFKFSGGKEILSDKDLDILCDRSDAAYDRASQGSGNADGYRVVTTGANGLTAISD